MSHRLRIIVEVLEEDEYGLFEPVTDCRKDACRLCEPLRQVRLIDLDQKARIGLTKQVETVAGEAVERMTGVAGILSNLDAA